MSQNTVTFYFQPELISPEGVRRPENKMLVAVDIGLKTLNAIGEISDENGTHSSLNIRIPSRCYQDPILLSVLDNRSEVLVEKLNSLPHNAILNGDIQTSINIEANSLTGEIMMSFRSNMGHATTSEQFSFNIFTDAVIRTLNGSPLEERDVRDMFGGFIIINVSSEMSESSELKDFDIPLVRKSFSKPKTIRVRARNIEEAEEYALDIAGDFEFSEAGANYQVV